MAEIIIMLIRQLDGHLCFVTMLPPEQKWIMGSSWSIWILMRAVQSAAWCQPETAWAALNAGKSTTWTPVDRSFSACLSAGQSPLWSGMNSSTSFGWIAMKLWADMFPRGWIQLITSGATCRSEISLIQSKYLEYLYISSQRHYQIKNRKLMKALLSSPLVYDHTSICQL